MYYVHSTILLYLLKSIRALFQSPWSNTQQGLLITVVTHSNSFTIVQYICTYVDTTHLNHYSGDQLILYKYERYVRTYCGIIDVT